MRSMFYRLVTALLTVVVMGAVLPAWDLQAADSGLPHDGVPPNSFASSPPSWLEPRGLNIVDLVGWVPESDLAGAIIQYTPGFGILRYVSGSRIGNSVTITATAYPRYYAAPNWSGSLFGCLGQGARVDELGVVAPATRLRVYTSGGQEITQLVDGYSYVPAGLLKPIRNPRESEITNQYRYWETGTLAASHAADGALLLPANMGCKLTISHRDYRELTLVFEAEVEPVVAIEVLGRQTYQIPVYFGPGFAGHLSALRDQLARTCVPTSPVSTQMTIPPDADYFLFTYPPVPADPYTAFPSNPLGNVDRPTGSTYRILTPRGLSVDHTVSVGFPTSGHWVDMDLAPDAQYLPYSRQVTAFGGMEPLLPAGISYDSCMVYGNCSAAKLAEICRTIMPGQMIYLKVERIQAGLSRIPLQMPGPVWHADGTSISEAPVSGAAVPQTTFREMNVSEIPDLLYKAYLTIVAKSPVVVEPDDPTGCSANGGCGWFTPDGRMVDYIALP